MAGRWTANAISLDERGDELPGAEGKSPWLRMDTIATLRLLPHPGQLSFCTQGLGAAKKRSRYTLCDSGQPGSPYRDTGADT